MIRKKILVADDEELIRSLLKDHFETEGYLVLTARDGHEALEKASQSPDLILLDVNMPGPDGMEVCRTIRAHVSCPILFLTARVDEQDRVNGLRMGGDDYILKPFSIDELTARVDAHLRREERASTRTEAHFSGSLAIDYAQRAVFYNGKPMSFAKKEFDIIELLSMRAGQVFDRESIYEKLWGWDSEGDSAVIKEHIRRIRAKLAEVSEREYIETVWGVGYKWVK